MTRDRTKELDRATREGGPLIWIGTRERLISTDAIDRRVLILHLEKTCRAERQRGLAGHWSYDVARHSQLRALLDAERRELSSLLEVAS